MNAGLRGAPASVASRRAHLVSTARRAPAVLGSRASWILLAVVVVALLCVGSIHPGPATRADRITYLDSIIKCPVCEDVSIAGSNAQQAVNLRAEVAELVDSGRTDLEVEQYVVAQFGTDELLRPTDPLVWVLPIAAFALAAAILAVVLLRRRGAPEHRYVALDDEAIVVAALVDRTQTQSRR